MNANLIILQGLPGCGKSTYAKELTKKGYYRINGDTMREMLNFGEFSFDAEALVNQMMYDNVLFLLSKNKKVVLDNTNISKSKIKELKSFIKKNNIESVEWKFIDTPLEECIERDSKRQNPVGETEIRAFHLRAFNEKPVVIFDIDGTLANTDHRVHFLKGKKKDWKSFFEAADKDEVYEEELNLLKKFHDEGHYIFLLTGRPEAYRELTENWLQQNDIPYDILMMRPDNYRRSNVDFKYGVWYKHLRSANVVAAYDDDQKVVDMWNTKTKVKGINVEN